jgi:hypothetical protein
MDKDKLYIHDTMFQHAKSSSWYNEPDLFEWVRKYDENYLILTDYSLTSVDNFSNNKKYAWLLESPEITPFAYNYVKEHYDKFDLIFTFDKDLLALSDKFVLVPYGGCWIEDIDRQIHNKTKDVSIILSAKKKTIGHRLRHYVYDNFKNLDSFGYKNPIEKKITALKDYRFSIVIENCQKDYYFSEKLIDCFITGTIPIYWGCPSIDKFFETEGMLIFNTIDELDTIINSLSCELYESKKQHIKNNFETSKNYLVADNILYNKLKEYEKILG